MHAIICPTAGTVGWLDIFLKGRKAIEIGSGAGDLAHYLNIPATDNRMQERPEIAYWYRKYHQPIIQYGANVECLEAQEAIEKYKPEVIIAAWVTQWVDPNFRPANDVGCMFGPKEDEIVATGIPYIMIGNLITHKHKPIQLYFTMW